MGNIGNVLLSSTFLSIIIRVSSITYHDHAITYADKNDSTPEKLSDYLSERLCTSLNYLHRIKLDGCLAVSLKTKICVGFCHAGIQPRGFQEYLLAQRRCVACSPGLIGVQEVVMLCKRKHRREGQSEMKTRIFKTRVV